MDIGNHQTLGVAEAKNHRQRLGENRKQNTWMKNKMEKLKKKGLMKKVAIPIDWITSIVMMKEKLER
ncbi:hypothetical protein chiPu_0007383 [Chiloscyllium punctatum]|uniref:Uncharacterized protein n=1 Tax=Chiloscyllium punctatum TaxID=137246 RepID=A0A401SEX3_CHIPU|nr:hypothetical protein [Chiloscyllium punctatum]